MVEEVEGKDFARCFGRYKWFIGHENCRCDGCIARDECRLERDRRRAAFLESYVFEHESSFQRS